MTNVKTAISLQQSLFEQVEALAQELQISRSRLFVLAVEAFIQRYQNRQLLAAINEAYDDLPDSEEQSLRHQRRQQHRQMVEGQW
jgi:metal-responsive CopG/Arc/MetJ family transcriptional regulator